ncbi:unnamed protein product [Calicophoron daubneyi]
MSKQNRLSYTTLRARLNDYRLARSSCDENIDTPIHPIRKVRRIDALQRSEELTQLSPPSCVCRILSSFYFQLFGTVGTWFLAVYLGFGSVCFVLCALYWIWAWGTNKHSRPRNPDEPVISAGFFFDSSPVPMNSGVRQT